MFIRYFNMQFSGNSVCSGSLWAFHRTSDCLNSHQVVGTLFPLSHRCSSVYLYQHRLCGGFFVLIWQPPAFPYRLQYSIIGRLGLNHRVRDVYGCFSQAHRHQKCVLCCSVSPFPSGRSHATTQNPLVLSPACPACQCWTHLLYFRLTRNFLFSFHW